MMYSAFADFYDELTGNISYAERANYFDSIIKEFKTEGPILLDLACGTGSLSVEFARLGYDVIGIDNSADMFSGSPDLSPVKIAVINPAVFAWKSVWIFSRIAAPTRAGHQRIECSLPLPKTASPC